MKDLGTIGFRVATEDDVAFLLELRRRTMTAHQVASGVVPSAGERDRRVRVAYEWAQIILDGDRAIGLLKVDRQQSCWELVQIQLLPELHGRGLGTRILESLVKQADAARASVKLSVLRANPAQRLYKRLGFSAVSEDATSVHMLRNPLPK